MPGDETDDWIPAAEWATVVRHVPIVSVDLVVHHDGGVVLGRRRNEPAKGEWLIPGGRVRKHERLADAARRVCREELGVEVRIARRLGVYEHFYDVADVDGVGGKHYVPVGFVVEPLDDGFEPDPQHDAFRVFHPPFEDVPLHEYVETYFRDAGLLGAH